MAFSLKKLAEITDSSTLGDKTIVLKDIASLESANGEQISFLSNPKYIKQLESTQAIALILTPDVAKEYLSKNPKGNILVNEDPYLTFAKVVNAFYKSENEMERVSQVLRPCKQPWGATGRWSGELSFPRVELGGSVSAPSPLWTCT